MDNFQIDARLHNDCHILGKLENSHVLLMDNEEIPWFVLVPETSVIELYQLDHQHQLELMNQVNLFSTYIQHHYAVDKLNVGAIGNVVEQLHIHIIGRFKHDRYWPSVVWGTQPQKNYTDSTIEEISRSLEDYFAGAFIRN